MKATLIAAAAAALLGSANAHRHGHHHRDLFRRNYTEICQTFVTTITGSPIWVPTPACSNCPVTTPVVPVANTTVVVPTPKTTPPTTPAVPATTSSKSTTPATTPATTTSKTVPATTPHPYTVPTAVVEVCPTPDTYTFPATTVVVTETTTVCGASPTKVPSGTHTLGGVTTVVTTATTVTCPVATTSTASGGVVTSVIQTTTYVCPSAGTYTINPITTTCTEETLVVVPVVTSFTPGTYTKPAVVTTVTETSVVVVCPFDIPTPTPAPAPAPATTTVAKVETPKVETPKVETTTQAVKVETPKVETPVKVETTTQAVETPKTTPKVLSATTVATTSPKASATTPAKSKSGGGLGSSNDHWAITYTPYGNGGACKGKSEVLSDLQGIKEKGFTTIRVYSTDCDTLPNVGAGCAATGLKMIIGVYVGEVGCDNGNPDVASQLASIKEWGQWDLVELVVVGNEAGHNGFCTPQELKSLIGNVKEIITSAGKSVPVTTTDTVATWQNTEFAEAICGVIDVVACNAHAYFNAETTPSQAGTFVKGQLDIVKEICGLEGYVLESGWPSECVANGVATCSQEDQEVAITSLKKELGGSIVFFSFGDDDWKDNGSCGCEQHWGCGQLF